MDDAKRIDDAASVQDQRAGELERTEYDLVMGLVAEQPGELSQLRTERRNAMMVRDWLWYEGALLRWRRGGGKSGTTNGKGDYVPGPDEPTKPNYKTRAGAWVAPPMLVFETMDSLELKPVSPRPAPKDGGAE
jgi:hypothetical protein